MASVTGHPVLRWLAPALAAALVVGIPVGISTSALAEPALPERSAHELLVDAQGVRNRAISGEITQVANLGLPELPGFATPSVSDASLGSLLTLASGTHTWRVWNDGAQASRVALVAGSNETDVVRNGRDVWVWSSADRAAVHSTLPDRSSPSPTPASTTADPSEVAATLLANLDPTTDVTVGRADRVAGRPVYELILTPTQAGTKVGRVLLALDAETTVPLRVQVVAHDGTNALDVAYTSVSFDRPDPAVFTFAPPPGATVSERAGETCTDPTECQAAGPKQKVEPRTVGTGWTTVMVAEAPSTASGAATGGADSSVSAVLEQLPKVSGSWGTGRLLDGTLGSAILTDDGRVAVGAVAPEALYAALKR